MRRSRKKGMDEARIQVQTQLGVLLGGVHWLEANAERRDTALCLQGMKESILSAIAGMGALSWRKCLPVVRMDCLMEGYARCVSYTAGPEWIADTQKPVFALAEIAPLSALVTALVQQAQENAGAEGCVHVATLQHKRQAHLMISDTGNGKPSPDSISEVSRLSRLLGGHARWRCQPGMGATVQVSLPGKKRNPA